MRVLVTGGCGFIGANLVPRLAAAGWQVRVLDNEIIGRRHHLDEFTGEFINGDIRDPAALDLALDGVDAVVHLAADTRVIESIADPAFNFDVNVVGSFRLIEAMRARGIGRLVNASTGGAIIGDATPPVHEGMVPNPIAPYGATKLAVEGLCSAWSGSYGFSALSLRFANVYGPRSYHKGSVVAAFFRRIAAGLPLIVHGDGEQVRDLQPGARVMGFAAKAFATHVTADRRVFVPVPARLSLEAAATVPVAFLTAWYSLLEVARVKRGEWVLIHGAAGGVGLAASRCGWRAVRPLGHRSA
jgi:nucleoside-diphosphate-sugar epimerase